jgi:cell division transport system ATP-binding protein
MIQFTNVHKSYDNGKHALKGASFAIDEGEFVFLVGPSGSGKSTIMKLFTGEIKPSQGSVEVNGFNVGKIRRRKMAKLRRTLGVVFQDFRLIEKKTVYDNIALAMRVFGQTGKEIRKRVGEVLSLVGLEKSAHAFPPQLSGGEQQRVAIARALVNKPSLIIADEPTGNIDPARSLEIMHLLERINGLGTTVVVVTHEKELVNRFNRRVIAIDKGRIVRDSIGSYDEAAEQLTFDLAGIPVVTPDPGDIQIAGYYDYATYGEDAPYVPAVPDEAKPEAPEYPRIISGDVSDFINAMMSDILDNEKPEASEQTDDSGQWSVVSGQTETDGDENGEL